jgi:hypothetical protein
MSKRFDNGSHYENHQRADELHDGAAAHQHIAGEQHGKQDHLTGHEHSRQQHEHWPQPHEQSEPFTFGHKEIAALAHELWQRRGCPIGSADEDWFRAVEELRSRAMKH